VAAEIVAIRLEARSPAKRRWRPSEPMVLFVVLFLLYFAAACYLALVANVLYTDAWARVAAAQRVLFSRDPHLAALGFYWSPLPALAVIPLVPLKFFWPQLTTVGLAGGIVSSASMAGGAVQLRGFLSELGLRRVATLILTATFAFHPIVVLYGANGMSEGMLLLFLLMATRYLARWLRDASLSSLVATSIALALAYLTRYESLGAAVGVGAVVAAVSFQRARRDHLGLSPVLVDLTIVGSPAAFALVIWAIMSWVITGQPFNELTSVYGTASQFAASNDGGIRQSITAVVRLMMVQLASLEPLLPVILLLSVRPLRRRALSDATSPLACLGVVLGSMIFGELKGALISELRYLIVLVPLAVTLAGVSLSFDLSQHHGTSRLGWALALVTAACLLVVMPVSALGLIDARVNTGSGNAKGLASLFSSSPASENIRALNWATDREVAHDLDSLHLTSGTVLVDDFLGFPIVVSSSNPRQFVITSDRDFQSVVADPRGAGIEYILVPESVGMGTLDAVNRQYPDLFETGGGFATLVKEYPSVGVNEYTWRLYRVSLPGVRLVRPAQHITERQREPGRDQRTHAGGVLPPSGMANRHQEEEQQHRLAHPVWRRRRRPRGGTRMLRQHQRAATAQGRVPKDCPELHGAAGHADGRHHATCQTEGHQLRPQGLQRHDRQKSQHWQRARHKTNRGQVRVPAEQNMLGDFHPGGSVAKEGRW